MSEPFAPPPGGTSRPRDDARAASGDDPALGGSGQRTPARGGGTTTARKAGPGMAIAAWVAIAAGVALLIGLSWSAALDWQARGLEPADADATGDLHAMQVVAGMCLEGVGEDGSVTEAVVVDCSEPHRAEVISQLFFERARFPGDAQAAERALDYCAPRANGVGPEGTTWVAWVPTADSWHRGDTTALCVLVFPDDLTERVGPDRSRDGVGGDEDSVTNTSEETRPQQA